MPGPKSGSFSLQGNQPCFEPGKEVGERVSQRVSPWNSTCSSTEDEGSPFTVRKLQGCLRETQQIVSLHSSSPLNLPCHRC